MSRTAIQHSRYECKYLIDPSQVPAMRRYLQPFARPDSHAKASGGIYTISSLYLDSSDHRLLRMGQEGINERFKLRARTYSDHPDEPVWLEVKRRHSGVVHKLRARVGRATARALIASRGSAPEVVAADIDISAFRQALVALAARPTAHVRYQREAYEARAGDVRVTFDTHIECAQVVQGEFCCGRERWYPAGIDGVVLEIKFTDVYPPWIRSLLARFELERRSISKYTQGMELLAARTLASTRERSWRN